MPVISFKPQFADVIISGEKTQTIRVEWRRPIMEGQLLHLYSGLRTAGAKKLGIGKVVAVDYIVIARDIYINYSKLTPIDMLLLAKADGFQTVNEFQRFFATHYGLYFEGVVIKWQLLDKEQ